MIYDYVSWTLTKAMEKTLNEYYTPMLQVLNKSWKDHITNNEYSKYFVFLISAGDQRDSWNLNYFFGNLPMEGEK